MWSVEILNVQEILMSASNNVIHNFRWDGEIFLILGVELANLETIIGVVLLLQDAPILSE